MHEHRADDTGVIGESRLFGVRSKPGVRKANQLGPFEGEDYALAIEIGLGEVERLERVDRQTARGAASQWDTVPERGNSGRVAIGKRPILDHSTPGQSGDMTRRLLGSDLVLGRGEFVRIDLGRD